MSRFVTGARFRIDACSMLPEFHRVLSGLVSGVAPQLPVAVNFITFPLIPMPIAPVPWFVYNAFV